MRREDRVRPATKGALVLGLVAAGLVLLTRVVLVPWIEGVHAWVIPPDAWTPLRAARSVANGDVFHLYEPLAGRTGYPYTPGLPILLAPVVAIGDHFHLLGDLFFPHPYPGMFLVLGPAEAFVGTFPIVFVAGHTVDGSRITVWRVQVLTFLAAAWAPVGFLHPEDTIVCALVIGACLRTQRGDWRTVGAFIGVALLFKQWALWPALPLLFAAPRHKRSLTAFYACALPALVLAPFLLATSATWTSLANTRASFAFGQQQLWLAHAFGHDRLGDPGMLRLAWGAASVLIALRARRRPDVNTLLAAAGTIMVLRLFFEPVLFGYYLVPATVFSVVWCARNGRPIVLRAFTACLLGAFCLPHTFPQPVFFALLAFGLAYVCGPMLETLLRASEQKDHRSLSYPACG